MEDLLAILKKADQANEEFKSVQKKFSDELRELFHGIPIPDSSPKSSVPISPQQMPKRVKHLSAVQEDTGAARKSEGSPASNANQVEDNKENSGLSEASSLMPPPPQSFQDRREDSITRPQRAAKLRVENMLKEPSLHTKLRQPGGNNSINVKKESEQRSSQINIELGANSSGDTLASGLSKALSAPAGNDEEVICCTPVEETNKPRSLRVRLKRENSSQGINLENNAAPLSAAGTASSLTENSFKVPMPKPIQMSLKVEKSQNDATSASSTILETDSTNMTTTASSATKKGRRPRRECMHKPIKVERFSDIDKMAPIAMRTRSGAQQRHEVESKKHEEQTNAIGNETVTISTSAPVTNDATFKIAAAANKPNDTITISKHNHICDATFDLPPQANPDVYEQNEGKGKLQEHKNLLADNEEDDVQSPPLRNALKSNKTPATAPISLIPTPSKNYKMPPHTHELFNPHVQSPVKMRVAAFENASLAASSDLPRRNTRQKSSKESSGSQTTPVIGKINISAASRFLTPTQSSQTAISNSAQPRRAPNSANKAISGSVLTKSSSGTNLRALASSAKATLSRENSSDDLRKGMLQQREQKRLLATQQRDAKLRERSEHLAKLAKEKEEKRFKKLQEQEQKKRENEELLRKVEQKKRQAEENARRQKQEEAALALKKAKAKEQERELLAKMNQPNSSSKLKQMLPPPPKTQTAYTFEMLHEDDSTDDEGKVTYKRPPVPHWSRSNVRLQAIVMQQHCPLEVIDNFFSVQPTTPDLKVIFPSIDPRYLKRNSSANWATPPRYSELPKY